ncbi:hypothetical protein L218DRAFT_167629 [Marasmius fiardii PR-910]|nr:hypothetical protein L218DRAFT_167629 [Marasmius fiardii PR-910]
MESLGRECRQIGGQIKGGSFKVYSIIPASHCEFSIEDHNSVLHRADISYCHLWIENGAGRFTVYFSTEMEQARSIQRNLRSTTESTYDEIILLGEMKTLIIFYRTI